MIKCQYKILYGFLAILFIISISIASAQPRGKGVVSINDSATETFPWQVTFAGSASGTATVVDDGDGSTTVHIGAPAAGAGGESTTVSDTSTIDLTLTGVDITAALIEAGAEAILDHDDLQGFVSNEHIDWTAATQDLYTTGAFRVDGTGQIGGTLVVLGNVSGANLSGTNTGDDDVPEAGDFGAAVDLDANGEVADDSHNHIITNIDAFTKANLETQTSDVSDYAEADGDTFTGVHDFGGATSLEIVNAANPTVDTDGEIAIDTTEDQFLYDGSASLHAIAYKYDKSFSLESPVEADDNVPIWSPPYDITVYEVYCRTQGGTSCGLIFSDGTNEIERVDCDSNGKSTTITTNNTWSTNERFEFDATDVVGSPTWVNPTVRFTIDRK